MLALPSQGLLTWMLRWLDAASPPAGLATDGHRRLDRLRGRVETRPGAVAWAIGKGSHKLRPTHVGMVAIYTCANCSASLCCADCLCCLYCLCWVKMAARCYEILRLVYVNLFKVSSSRYCQNTATPANYLCVFPSLTRPLGHRPAMPTALCG